MQYYKITQHLNEFAYNYFDWVCIIGLMLLPIPLIVFLVILFIKYKKECK